MSPWLGLPLLGFEQGGGEKEKIGSEKLRKLESFF